MANRPAYWVRLGRWIRGRCSECGARDWARPNDRKHATPVTTLRHLESKAHRSSITAVAQISRNIRATVRSKSARPSRSVAHMPSRY